MLVVRSIALALCLVAGMALYARSGPDPTGPTGWRRVVCLLNPVRAEAASELDLLRPAQDLVDRGRLDEAYAAFEALAPQAGKRPVSLMSEALDRSLRREEGARWFEGWFGRAAGSPGFPEDACQAGLFVSEYGSPTRAADLLRLAVRRHPEEMMPRVGLATVLIHLLGTARLEPDERGRLLEEAEVQVEESLRLARTGPERFEARKLKLDVLAFAGRDRAALRLFEELEASGHLLRTERPERTWEAGVLAARLGRMEEARGYFERALRAYDELEPEDPERQVPIPEMVLAGLYVFHEEPVDPAVVARVAESHRFLESRGSVPAEPSARLFSLPDQIRGLEAEDPAALRALVEEMAALEAYYGPEADLVPCLTWLTNIRPLAVATSYVVRGDALAKLGEPERAQEHYRAALDLFPHADAVARRMKPRT